MVSAAACQGQPTVDTNNQTTCVLPPTKGPPRQRAQAGWENNAAMPIGTAHCACKPRRVGATPQLRDLSGMQLNVRAEQTGGRSPRTWVPAIMKECPSSASWSLSRVACACERAGGLGGNNLARRLAGSAQCRVRTCPSGSRFISRWRIPVFATTAATHHHLPPPVPPPPGGCTAPVASPWPRITPTTPSGGSPGRLL